MDINNKNSNLDHSFNSKVGITKLLKIKKCLILIIFVTGLSACAGDDSNETQRKFEPVFTGPDENGVIVFQSLTPANHRELINGRGGLPQVDVFGTLHMPQDTSSPVPAMVMSHGSSGIVSNFYNGRAAELNSLGIAVFVIDSLRPRGGVQITLGAPARLADALIALAVLSQLPEIDPDRIGHIGYSLGGRVSVNSAYSETQNIIASTKNKFKVHIAYYAECSIRHFSPNVTQAPMLFFHGELDDWTRFESCVDLVDSLNAVGANASIFTYPGVHHAFNGGGPQYYIPDAKIPLNCRGETRLDTFQKSRFDTGEIFPNGTAYRAYLDGCITFGGNVGGDDAAAVTATEDANTRVATLLADVFGL